jgi:hypothetical protein
MVKVLVGAVAVIVLLAVVAWAVRRRGNDEAHSVDGYRHTLDTLQGIRSRSGTSSVRVLGSARDAVVDDGPPSPASETSGPDLVFEDRRSLDPLPSAPTRSSRRTQERAISAMNRRPRRLVGPVLVAVVLVGLVAAVVAVGAHDNKHRTTTSTTRSSSRTTATSVAHHSSSTTTPGKETGVHKKASRAASTTTAPPSFVAVTSTATTATYTPPAGTYLVTFTTTTGACWITVRSAGGTSLLSQTLPAGQSRSVTTNGKATIVLGAPTAVHLTIDHEPLVLPTGFQTPFSITLVPASA